MPVLEVVKSVSYGANSERATASAFPGLGPVPIFFQPAWGLFCTPGDAPCPTPSSSVAEILCSQ